MRGDTKTMREYARSHATAKPHANVIWYLKVPEDVTIDPVMAGQIAQGMLASLTHEVIRSAGSAPSSLSDSSSSTPGDGTELSDSSAGLLGEIAVLRAMLASRRLEVEELRETIRRLT
jgi:hypothetical protein